MIKRLTFYLFTVLIATTLFSCFEVGKQVVDWMELKDDNTEVELKGEYHFLEENGVRIFLPLSFKRYSMAEYQQTLKTKLPEEEANAQIKNINHKANLDGELYIYFDEESGSTCLVFGMPYMEISKRDAQLFLGMMRTQTENLLDSSSSYEKITAKYVGYPKNCIFKSVYKISSEAKNFEYYNALYFISRNSKTIAYQLITPVGVYFDPFIEKLEI
ncbi:MAG TPA: hypothetical protein PKH16_11295 [Aequorivita sp.]|jgi:hypothetical protein|nr:hypothetical protein [Aequorivita sp.]MBP41602.1 hypothetical protein [Aequorivita sp.]HBC05927.1 hypothetical protein [Aequorivita sp.]HNP68483.1 hypothetical protein [Aequorivita sp.]|tara:strand:- start:120725 stop:121372 length:648 start_codon:yes stop_codon:yes gene_type:complete